MIVEDPALSLLNQEALNKARDYSNNIIQQIQIAVADLPSCLPEISSLAVSGSLGRLEAGSHSDADLLVILADQATNDPSWRSHLMDRLWKRLSPLGLRPPRPTGIYATPATPAQLTDSSQIGRVAEDLPTFGKRIQAILDSRPVFGAPAFEQLQRAILLRYFHNPTPHDPDQDWRYLLDDLIRYFRSLSVQERWDFAPRSGGWFLRQIKLRHSRVVLYAGMLFLLAEASQRADDRVSWLQSQLQYTPLERLARVYDARKDRNFGQVATLYAHFLQLTDQSSIRADLRHEGPLQLPVTAIPPIFAELEANGQALAAELIRFLLEHRPHWSKRFFQDLLF